VAKENFLFQNVHTGSGTNPALCLLGAGVCTRGKPTAM